MPTKSIQTNPNKQFKEIITKQPRKIHHTTDLIPNNNQQHQIITNPYLQSILHPSQTSIHNKQPLHQLIVSQSPDPPSKELTQPTNPQNTTSNKPNIYTNLYRERIKIPKEGSVQSNGNNNTITTESETTINNNTIPTQPR